ncbi:heme/hemin ABC transporter substrate-binding protein [Halomonas sp. C22]|uniref:heme/hemin ABC transporter substrate-binding protein n=1 Tax=Halomonas sp. C22 TaxID=2580567 RepID=UPI00119ED0FD|nr:ABC transporter substrate-binding protein [Halomonas sp. C22]
MRLVGHAFALRPFRALGVALLGLALSASALASERWLVLGGDIAETLSALGAEQHVVARDDTVVYPPEMAALPSVGYLRQLSAESVLSVSPTRILAAEQAGPREVLEQLAAVGVAVEVVSAPASLEAIAHKVRHISEYIGEPQAGSALAELLTSDLERLAALPPLPDIQAMFILQHSGLTPRAAGRETAAHTALEAVGLHNAFAEMTGYHNVSAEALVQRSPEVVVMSTRGLEALGGEAALWSLPGMAMTPAGSDQRLIVVDDQALLGFGPRTPEALLTLRQQVEALLSHHAAQARR